MKTFANVLQTLVFLGAGIYLVLHGHPFMAGFCLLFVFLAGKSY